MITWFAVPEIWCMTDGQIDGQKKGYIEVGAPPRKETGLQSLFQWVEYGSFYKLPWKASSLKELKNNNTWNNIK